MYQAQTDVEQSRAELSNCSVTASSMLRLLCSMQQNMCRYCWLGQAHLSWPLLEVSSSIKVHMRDVQAHSWFPDGRPIPMDLFLQVSTHDLWWPPSCKLPRRSCSLRQLKSLQNEGRPELQVRINNRQSGTEGSGSQPSSPMQSWHATPRWPAGTTSSSSQAALALDPIVSGQPAGSSASPTVGFSPSLAGS